MPARQRRGRGSEPCRRRDPRARRCCRRRQSRPAGRGAAGRARDPRAWPAGKTCQSQHCGMRFGSDPRRACSATKRPPRSRPGRLTPTARCSGRAARLRPSEPPTKCRLPAGSRSRCSNRRRQCDSTTRSPRRPADRPTQRACPRTDQKGRASQPAPSCSRSRIHRQREMTRPPPASTCPPAAMCPPSSPNMNLPADPGPHAPH